MKAQQKWNPEWTDTQIVEHVRDCLLEQGRRSTHAHSEACMYNGAGGTHCAVGWLMPEPFEFFEDPFDNAVIRFEDHIEHNGVRLMPALARYVPIEEWREWGEWVSGKIHLFLRMQEIHDQDNPDDWGLSFRELLNYIDKCGGVYK